MTTGRQRSTLRGWNRPIHELLARIRHDEALGSGGFEIGYLDRRESPVLGESAL